MRPAALLVGLALTACATTPPPPPPEDDVLERIHAGLCSGDSGVNAAQAWWVTRRLAELLGWEWSRTAPARAEGP